MQPPPTIFKYEPFTLRAIQNLKASSVYFGSPASFNDPYDCALAAAIAETPPEELKRLYIDCLTNTSFAFARDELAKLTLPEFEEQSRRGAQIGLDEARQRFMTKTGVTCFSETQDNLLMWSHYGGRYKGFCLEFRTNFDPFRKLQPIVYRDAMPLYRLADVLGDQHEYLKQMFCTKSSAWAYEKEWRVLHSQSGTMFTYQPEALKAIYFGPDITDQDRDLICNILYCQNPNAELWQGRRSTRSFKVEFEKLPGYVPYWVARQNGMIES